MANKKSILTRIKEREAELTQSLVVIVEAVEPKTVEEAVDALIHDIAHCVSHGLLANPKFNVELYIAECRVVMEDALVPLYIIEDILDEAETQGLLAVRSPIGESPFRKLGGAAQISPVYNPSFLKLIDTLNNLLLEVN